jgi:hypothetical protein
MAQARPSKISAAGEKKVQSITCSCRIASRNTMPPMAKGFHSAGKSGRSINRCLAPPQAGSPHHQQAPHPGQLQRLQQRGGGNVEMQRADHRIAARDQRRQRLRIGRIASRSGDARPGGNRLGLAGDGQHGVAAAAASCTICDPPRPLAPRTAIFILHLPYRFPLVTRLAMEAPI